MKTFVINLDRNEGRLAAVSKRLAERGIAFERFPAVDGRVLGLAEKQRCYSAVWTSLVRGHGLLPGELGCTLSHLRVYRKMVEERLGMACVMEDDAFPEPGFYNALTKLETELDVRRAQVVLLSPISYEREAVRSQTPGLRRILDGMFTDAYVITLPAAEAILRQNDPIHCMCDYWGYLSRRAHFELYQFVPSISRQDSAGFGTDVAGAKPAWVGTWRWKMWRLFGKTVDWMIWRLTGK